MNFIRRTASVRRPRSTAYRKALALFAAICLYSQAAFAVPLIRDAEIEHTLHKYGDPLFRVNGIKPSTVKIFIVNDDSLNAYVAGGANMFIHTGLIMDCETPGMLIAVMAHETGHISGGHLARGAEKLKNASMGSIFTFVLGAAAAAASGKPEAAAAVITGGSNAVARNFLAFTRANEDAADQSGMAALDKLHISATGMMKVFELLRRHEREHSGSPDPYMLTHPLTTARIENVRDHINRSKIPADSYPREYDSSHQRMIAKLYGFIESPEQTMMKYPLSNKSVAARMARAIAYYKLPDMNRAITEMDALIAESPNDPFFHELKGQILFENNRPKEALTSYQEAVKLLPNAPLILADLAKVELAQPGGALTQSAIMHLEKASSFDNSDANIWHNLGIAYGKAGQQGMSDLALAEEAILQDDVDMALKRVNSALPKLSAGTPAKQRAQDLKARALDMQREKKEDDSLF